MGCVSVGSSVVSLLDVVDPDVVISVVDVEVVVIVVDADVLDELSPSSPTSSPPHAVEKNAPVAVRVNTRSNAGTRGRGVKGNPTMTKW